MKKNNDKTNVMRILDQNKIPYKSHYYAGMKKQFKTTIDISATDFDTIVFSGGEIGYQVQLSLEELKRVLLFDLSDICD